MVKGLDPRVEEILRLHPRLTMIQNDLLASRCGPLMSHLDSDTDPTAFYARFLLWTRRFDEYDTILHLDADTLVCAPLDGLFENEDFTIFPESYESENHTFTDHRDAELCTLLADDGLPLDSARANAGVFVLPRQWRGEPHYTELCALLERYRKHIRWADQSIINLWMMRNNIPTSCDRRWNFQHRWFNDRRYAGNLPDAKILHFNGLSGVARYEAMVEALCYRVSSDTVYSTEVSPLCI